MSLTVIRALVISNTGRTDLGALDGSTDAGVNSYINAGQRFLDRLQPTPGSRKRFYADLLSGEYKVTMDKMRSVESVWATGTNGKRVELTREDIDTLRTEYEKDWDSEDTGTPAYYATGVHRLAPSQQQETDDSFDGRDDYKGVSFQANEGYDTLIVAPPVDELYTIDVFGEFYSPELGLEVASVGAITFTGLPVVDEVMVIDSTTFTWKAASGGITEITIGSTIAECLTNAIAIINAHAVTATASSARGTLLRITWDTAGTAGNSITFTTDVTLASIDGSGTLGGSQSGTTIVESWWTRVEPFALVYATNWFIETSYRNTEGAKDWMNSLGELLKGIDLDMAMSEGGSQINQMRG
jgi:hypothetical protein